MIRMNGTTVDEDTAWGFGLQLAACIVFKPGIPLSPNEFESRVKAANVGATMSGDSAKSGGGVQVEAEATESRPGQSSD